MWRVDLKLEFILFLLFVFFPVKNFKILKIFLKIYTASVERVSQYT